LRVTDSETTDPHGELRAAPFAMNEISNSQIGLEAADQWVQRVVDSARRVHGILGPGFIESIYSRALVIELKSDEFRVEREKLIKIWYGSLLIGKHCLDLVVNDTIILELKASRSIIPVHQAQMQSYLQASQYRLGLILNFGSPTLDYVIIATIGSTRREFRHTEEVRWMPELRQ
jgi:GxxExxY protein